MTTLRICLAILLVLTIVAGESGRDLPQPGKCGLGNQSDRIFGGTQTAIDEFPWMVLLKYRHPEMNKTILMCGGSLLNSRYVLTAAHCVEKFDLSGWDLTDVRLGEWNITSDPDCEDDCFDPVKDYKVDKVIIHEKYVTRAKQHHDIALLRLAEPVKYSYTVKPICLPTTDDLLTMDYVGKRLDVAGWGTTESSLRSDVKLKVDVPGISLDECNAAYDNAKNITDMQLCAGAQRGKDSCTGDSGGPLMATHKLPSGVTYHYLIGLVSYGYRVCGKEGKPGVYIRTGKYIDWIKENLEN